MKKIRICFILPAVWPLVAGTNEKTGGAEINLMNLATQFAKDDSYSVTFLVGDYGQKSNITINGVKWIKMPYFQYESCKFDRFYFKILREIFLVLKLLILNTDMMITSCGGGILGRLAIMKWIKGFYLVFRFANDFDTDPEYLKKNDSALVNRLYLYGLKHSDQLITQTVQQQQLLLDRLHYQSKLIQNGFEIPSIATIQQKKHILWVASASSVKRPELFVQLAELLPEYQFVMIMPGNGEIAERICQMVQSVQNLTLFRGVPFQDIQRWYDKALWFVNTSYFEGFPNSFIQSCLAATPVLSFLINPDHVVDQAGIGKMCLDSVELAADIIRTITDEDRYIMGQKGLDYVRSHHDIREKKSQYDAIFRHLLATENPSNRKAGI